MFTSPVDYDHRTGEPFIPLPTPLGPRIRLTLPKFGDKEDVIKHLNDPRVYMNLHGPPFPYTDADAMAWLPPKVNEVHKFWEEYKAFERMSADVGTDEGGIPRYVGGFPFRTIREVDEETGRDTFLGDVFFGRSLFFELVDTGERDQVMAENEEKANGDPSIMYGFGDYLAPSHHGRGIMTAAIKVILHSWAIPLMGARHITGSVLSRNVASRRVFEKNGFRMFLEDVGAADFTPKGGKVELHSHLKLDIET